MYHRTVILVRDEPLSALNFKPYIVLGRYFINIVLLFIPEQNPQELIIGHRSSGQICTVWTENFEFARLPPDCPGVSWWALSEELNERQQTQTKSFSEGAGDLR